MIVFEDESPTQWIALMNLNSLLTLSFVWDIKLEKLFTAVV